MTSNRTGWAKAAAVSLLTTVLTAAGTLVADGAAAAAPKAGAPKAGAPKAAAPKAGAPIPAPAAGRLASANPVNNTPHAKDGDVRAFAQIGNLVYVGGAFTKVRKAGTTAWQSRPHLFAYDRVTGAISSTFKPAISGSVNALLVNAQGNLVVGGAFKTVNGVDRPNLVAVNPTTGATVSTWTGKADGVVRSMRRSGDRIYLGGGFNWVDGVARHGLARINAATGAVDASFNVSATDGRNNVDPYVWTLDISPDGRKLVVGGNFSKVGGLTRNQIAMLDISATGTATVANWSTDRYEPTCHSPKWFTHYVQDVDFSDDGSYFIVGSNGGSGWPAAYCDTLARFETNTTGSHLNATWVDLTGNDTITSIEATDNVIYLGGHFRWLNNPHGSDAAGPGAVDRLGVAATNANNGMPLNWNPRRSGAPKGTTAWGSSVPVIWRGNDGIYLGQNSDGLGREYHGRFGMFPLAGGRMTPVATAPAGPPGYLYTAKSKGTLTRTPFSGSVLGRPTLVKQPRMTKPGVAMRAGGQLYWDVAGKFGFSSVNAAGVVGAPSFVGYNKWFKSSVMTGAFFLDGRMYYTRSGKKKLFFRYLEPDGHIVGASEFTVATAHLNWSKVRGMTWANGSILYGSADGKLRTVPFHPAAAGTTVDGNGATLLGVGKAWTHRTLFYAAS